MRRSNRFTMRVNDIELELITFLARSLQRTRSDAVRWLVREAVRELQIKLDTHGDTHHIFHDDVGKSDKE